MTEDSRGYFIRGESRDMWLGFALVLVVGIVLVIANEAAVAHGMSDHAVAAIGSAVKVVLLVVGAVAFDTMLSAVADSAPESQSEDEFDGTASETRRSSSSGEDTPQSREMVR